MLLETQKNSGLSCAQPRRKTPTIKECQNFLTATDLFGREHESVFSFTLALKLFEFLFVGNALHVHALGQLCGSP